MEVSLTILTTFAVALITAEAIEGFMPNSVSSIFRIPSCIQTFSEDTVQKMGDPIFWKPKRNDDLQQAIHHLLHSIHHNNVAISIISSNSSSTVSRVLRHLVYKARHPKPVNLFLFANSSFDVTLFDAKAIIPPRVQYKIVSFDKKKSLHDTATSSCTEGKITSLSVTPVVRTPREYRGAVMKAAVAESAKLQFYNLTRQFGRWTANGGSEYELLDFIAKRMGISYEIVVPQDNQWGSPQPNGSWTGIIRMLMKQEADISVNFVVMNIKRAEAVDFSTPYFSTSIKAITSVPGEMPKLDLILRPYTTQTWCAITASLLLVGVVTSILLKMTSRYCNISSDAYSVFWYFFGTLVAKGGNVRVTSISVIRAVSGPWWIFATVIMAAYSGKLISFLTITEFQEGIHTADSLQRAVEKDGYSCGAVSGSTEETFIMVSESSVMDSCRVTVLREPKNIVKNVEDGFERVLKSKFALIMNSHAIYPYLIEKGIHKFTVSKESFFSPYVGVALRKESLLRDDVNSAAMRAFETGLVLKWHDEKTKRKLLAYSPAVLEDPSHKLSLNDLQSCFYLLLSGYLLATVSLAVEVAVKSLKSCRWCLRTQK